MVGPVLGWLRGPVWGPLYRPLMRPRARSTRQVHQGGSARQSTQRGPSVHYVREVLKIPSSNTKPCSPDLPRVLAPNNTGKVIPRRPESLMDPLPHLQVIDGRPRGVGAPLGSLSGADSHLSFAGGTHGQRTLTVGRKPSMKNSKLKGELRIVVCLRSVQSVNSQFAVSGFAAEP